MRALVLTEAVGPDGLDYVTDAPEPIGDDSRILIEVAMSGVTFPDLLVTQGRYQHKPELPYIPGLEVSGVVRSAPVGSGFTAGERVAAACMGGGYAALASADPALCVRLPDSMSDEAGSGLVVNYQTMYFALHNRGNLQPGETILVLGAAGGIGIAAIQLAVAAGATVIAVCRGQDKVALCREAGAQSVLDSDQLESLPGSIAQLTQAQGVDVVVDPVGGEQFLDALRSLAPGGRLLVVGFAGGIPSVAANRLLFRNVSVVGVAWGAYLQHDPSVARTVSGALGRLAHDGSIAPPVGTVWPLHEGALALHALEQRTIVGKAALRVG